MNQVPNTSNPIGGGGGRKAFITPTSTTTSLLKKKEESQQFKLLQNDFYKQLWKQFDKGLNTTLESFKKTMTVSIQRVEQKIQSCEINLRKIVQKREQFFEKELAVAETLVNKELRSKVIISQWTNQFLSISENSHQQQQPQHHEDRTSPKKTNKSPKKKYGEAKDIPPPLPPSQALTQQTVLDPVTFAIIRFALNITLNYRDVNLDFILYTNIHKHLIHFISLTNTYLIIGPSLMALNHISLINYEIKQILVAEGILQNLLLLMTHSRLSNQVILSLCAKLCSSLALEQLNKSSIAKSGVFHVLFDLILGSHVDVNEMIQYYAITAIVNTLYHNEINRKYAIEINGIKPLLTVIQTTSDNQLIAQTMHALANIAYGNAFTANCILVGGGGEVIAEALSIVDILGNNYFIAQSALATYSNMCYSETNQTHIGNIEGLLLATVRICENGRVVSLINQVALFLLGLCWQNNINKSRVSNSGGCVALVHQIMRLSSIAMSIKLTDQSPPQLIQEKQEILVCIENLSLALASVLIYPATHERMISNNGVEDIIRICKITSEPLILKALSKVIVMMVPNPKDLVIIHKDRNKHLVEKLNVLPILKKVLLTGFADVAQAPEWLESVIEMLGMRDNDLEIAPDIVRKEFVEKLYYCQEFFSDVYPDADIYQRQEFRGYIFSIY